MKCPHCKKWILTSWEQTILAFVNSRHETRSTDIKKHFKSSIQTASNILVKLADKDQIQKFQQKRIGCGGNEYIFLPLEKIYETKVI